MTLDTKAIRAAAEAAIKKYGGYPVTDPAFVITLLDRLEAAEKEIQLVRNAALEEAAQVCDLECDNWANERPIRLCANLIRIRKS